MPNILPTANNYTRYSARYLLTTCSRGLLHHKNHALKSKNITSHLHKCLSSCVKQTLRNNPVNSDCATQNNQYQLRKYCVSISPSEETESWPKPVVIEGSRAQDIQKQDDGIILNYGKYSLNLLYIWLRDHCRCDACYNRSTNQKNVDSYTLSSDIKPEHIDYNESSLCVKWQDGHVTCYNLDWLLENTFHSFHQDRITKNLWNNHTLKDIPLPTVDYKHYMESDDGLQKHLSNLLEFGFSIVTGTPATHEGTLEVSERVCFLQETLFGRSWTFTADLNRKDTAYTNIPLGAHTDNTYFTTPSGIQVFHVVEHDGEGGETLLVDGFYAAEQLRQKDAEAYEFLTKKVVAHEYFEPKIKIRSLGTVLSLHPTTGRLMHIRYNPYDRSPLFTLSVEDTRLFYNYYQKLTQEVQNKDNEFWVKLRPDMVLFVDNWRVMHGRSGFTGRRYVSGCYLNRDDWISRARDFGLQSL